MKEYPLFSASFEGAAYADGRIRYEMVIITQWSDRTETASEVSRKVFYFKGNKADAERRLKELGGVAVIWNYPQYTKF